VHSNSDWKSVQKAQPYFVEKPAGIVKIKIDG
jgi:hypothetical protein